MKIPWHKRLYALYKGDLFIADGTIEEISDKTGKSTDHLRFMNTPAYAQRSVGSKNKLALVSLDDDADKE